MKNSPRLRSAGRFLFKFRSLTPIPLILLVVLFFKPVPWTKLKIPLIVAALTITLLGQFIRVLAVGFAGSGTSGRESYFRADSLNRDGLYSIVRNPLYIGNILIFNGLLILYGHLIAGLIFNIFLIGQYLLIILSEEFYLVELYGEQYSQYLQQVNRFYPNFTAYRRPETSFNLKKVVFKENDSVFNWLLMFVLIILYKDFQQAPNTNRNYLIYIVSGMVLILGYGCIKLVKKRSGRQKGPKEA